MAVLARVNWVAQQRVDLNHILAQESFLAFDFRSLLTGLSGNINPYILRGYEVVGKTGLTISIITEKSLVFNPLDGNGSFFAGGDDEDDILVDLPADQENIFVQARFINETRAPVNTAFWDALALTGDDVAGTEFTASTNTQNVIVLQIEANTVGFDEDAVPILRASTSASAVTEMVDARRMLYRLGSGGPTPNPLNKFPWSNTRQESVATGTGVGDETDSPFRSRDTTGVRNDKGIGSLKEWMDAVMTRISEIAGQALWYDNSSASSASGGLTLNTLFIDTIGHNIQPDADVSLKWSRIAGNLVLQSQGPASVKWQFNYGGLQWELGGTFVSNVAGGSRAYTDVKFTSPAPVDNGNLYLLLEREVPKGSGSAVTWANNSADPNLLEPRAISGVTGDFVGIAIGDYIRKESEGIQRYYKIVAMSDGTTITTTADYIADSTIVAVEVDRDIDSGVTAEPLRYWRAKYSNDDLVEDAVVGEYTHQDLSFYWLGRRRGTLFYLRGFGTMQEGEEVTLINDAFQFGSGGGGDLMIEHGYHTIYDASLGYYQNSGLGSMLTIRRRKRDNTVESPSSGDNSGAYLIYTLATPVGLLAVGDTLWVKLNDAAGGALAPGSVDGNTTDDENNTNTITNVWEIRTAAQTPLRNYDNRDVYPVARRMQITTPAGLVDALVFLDGSIITQDGQHINNNFATRGQTRFYNDDVHLMTRPAQSVLFIDDGVVGRIDDDVANFFYDKPNQILGLFNYRFGLNILTLDTPADLDWLPNLGAHTLDVGASTSTVRIRGDLLVLGATVSSQVTTIQSDDKLVTLGVGTTLNASGGTGFEAADNTVEVDSADSTIAIDYLDLTYGAAHGYVLGQDVGVSSNTDINGITAGQITGSYRVVATATMAGQAEVLSATELRIWTIGTATSTGTEVLAPPTTSIRTFDVLSWMKLTDADGDVSGMTSWAYKVKGLTQVVTMTPVTNYGIIPTAHSANFVAGRIPFANDDNAGPDDDSTLNFSPNFTWDNGTNTLTVNGAFALFGHFLPGTDDTYNIGSPTMRWLSGRFGSDGVTVHDDITSTDYVTMDVVGSSAQVHASTTLELSLLGSSVYISSAAGIVAAAKNNGAFALIPRTAPVTSADGDLYSDSTSRKLRHHDGIDWLDVDRGDIAGEMTGYEDRGDSTFSFVNGTRTFSIQPTGASYDFYIRGTRYRETGTKSIVLPNVTALYFIYFDTAQTLQQTTAFSPALLQSFAYTATVYWNAATGEAEFLSEERHGLTMDGETHAYLHLTQGTKYVSGLTLTPNAALSGDGSTDAQAQVAVTGGTIRDEDISITIVDDATPTLFFEQILSPTAQIPVAYRSGASGDWVKDTATLFPLKAGTLRPQWNEFALGTWSAVDASADGTYIAMWFFATNDVSEPITAVLGQDEYPDLATAQSEALYESLQFGTLPFQEFKLLFRVIYRTDSTYANTIKAAAYHITDYRKATDIALSSSYMPSDHGNLSGLGDDDHPQYLLLAGRAAGQTAYGGINSGDNLVLRSTSHGTKGQVWLDETTQSTSITTGAFRVDGGAAVGLNLWVGGQTASTGTLRALSAFRLEGTQTVGADTVLTSAGCFVAVDTTGSGVDINITLPPSDATTNGQILVLKDVGGQLSYLGKRAFLVPAGADTLITDQVHTSGTPFLWDIDYTSITLRSNGTGQWHMI